MASQDYNSSTLEGHSWDDKFKVSQDHRARHCLQTNKRNKESSVQECTIVKKNIQDSVLLCDPG